MGRRLKCKFCKEYFDRPENDYDLVQLWVSNFCCKDHRRKFLQEKTRAKREKEKESKLKKKDKKANSISRLTKKLDAIFSKYIRLRDALKTTWTLTTLKCYTCDALVEVEKAQNMHFVPRAVKQLRFDESNTRWGCMRCNVLMHWNYIEYFQRIEKELWRQKVDEMIAKKYETYSYTSDELNLLIETYTNKTKTLWLKEI